jgi:hypothetical protein
LPGAVALGAWGLWACTATSDSKVAAIVNDDVITQDEIEQRAHLLALSVNIAEQTKANFQRLVKSAVSDQMRSCSKRCSTRS